MHDDDSTPEFRMWVGIGILVIFLVAGLLLGYILWGV